MTERYVTPALCRGPPLVMPAVVREWQPCVYILASDRNGTLYVGVTSNLIGRIIQHRKGVYGGFTKRYGVHRLVWYDTADTMEVAIAVEKRIKRWPRDYKLNLIERDNPQWNDLAVGLGLPPLPRSSIMPGSSWHPPPLHVRSQEPDYDRGCRHKAGMTEEIGAF